MDLEPGEIDESEPVILEDWFTNMKNIPELPKLLHIDLEKLPNGTFDECKKITFTFKKDIIESNEDGNKTNTKSIFEKVYLGYLSAFAFLLLLSNIFAYIYLGSQNNVINTLMKIFTHQTILFYFVFIFYFLIIYPYGVIIFMVLLFFVQLEDI
jgi:hypothetical protein